MPDLSLISCYSNQSNPQIYLEDDENYTMLTSKSLVLQTFPIDIDAADVAYKVLEVAMTQAQAKRYSMMTLLNFDDKFIASLDYDQALVYKME